MNFHASPIRFIFFWLVFFFFFLHVVHKHTCMHKQMLVNQHGFSQVKKPGMDTNMLVTSIQYMGLYLQQDLTVVKYQMPVDWVLSCQALHGTERYYNSWQYSTHMNLFVAHELCWSILKPSTYFFHNMILTWAHFFEPLTSRALLYTWRNAMPGVTQVFFC